MKPPALFWAEAKHPHNNQWNFYAVCESADNAFKFIDAEIEEGSKLEWRVVRVERTVIVREDGE